MFNRRFQRVVLILDLCWANESSVDSLTAITVTSGDEFISLVFGAYARRGHYELTMALSAI